MNVSNVGVHISNVSRSRLLDQYHLRVSPKKPKTVWPWYYVTRVVGLAILLFGVFGDKTPERGTIILTGAGVAGFDKVARSEPKG